MNLANVISLICSIILAAIGIITLVLSRGDKKANRIIRYQDEINLLKGKIANYEDFDKHYIRVDEACFSKNEDGSPNFKDGPYCFNCAQKDHVKQILINRYHGYGTCNNCKATYVYNQKEYDRAERNSEAESQSNFW